MNANANALLVFWCPQEIPAFIKNFVLHLRIISDFIFTWFRVGFWYLL